MNQNPILLGVLIIGAIIGYFARQIIVKRQKDSLEQKITKLSEESEIKAKGIILAAQEKSVSLLEDAKKEEKERKIQFDRIEERLVKREESMEKQWADVRNQENHIKEESEKIKNSQIQVSELKTRLTADLQKIANLTETQAKEKLLEEIKEKYKEDLSSSLLKLTKERQGEIEKKSVNMMVMAMQRLARHHVAEATTSAFHLENEDLKGKIIGREGRNIKALERETGVEFIMDETPGSIVISSFDPMRREIAKMALEKLIKDGRIQPAKIEEKVEEARNEMNKRMLDKGEEAAHEVGIYNLPQEIIQLLGRLYFRTSYGQNVLIHSIECAHLATMIAEELGLNVEIAKAGALLHDIGKAIDQEVGGKHVEVGQRILKKFGIKDEIIHAMEAHHEEYPFSTPESYIVAAADALSASRPGARRDSVENYLKRLEELEKITKEFSGVKNAYALSAGREIRVFVIPEKIDDFGMLQLAKNIASKIESDLKYPGEIKVNVFRETRAVEYAK
ncbi:ribonuclease Y [Candidatus Wolfebacteria bacterium]|nr:ribonuclease Y [Candidatus Wolfebacteria bacterium]